MSYPDKNPERSQMNYNNPDDTRFDELTIADVQAAIDILVYYLKVNARPNLLSKHLHQNNRIIVVIVLEVFLKKAISVWKVSLVKYYDKRRLWLNPNKLPTIRNW